ncbi:MAG: hypothetical protein WD768_10790 [Phycisphaeraceae bacterium]
MKRKLSPVAVAIPIALMLVAWRGAGSRPAALSRGNYLGDAYDLLTRSRKNLIHLLPGNSRELAQEEGDVVSINEVIEKNLHRNARSAEAWRPVHDFRINLDRTHESPQMI